jgi:hypothetical protein
MKLREPPASLALGSPHNLRGELFDLTVPAGSLLGANQLKHGVPACYRRKCLQ